MDPVQYSKIIESVNKKEESAIKALERNPSGDEKMELLGQFIAKANDPQVQESQQPIPPMGGGMPPMAPPQTSRQPARQSTQPPSRLRPTAR